LNNAIVALVLMGGAAGCVGKIGDRSDGAPGAAGPPYGTATPQCEGGLVDAPTRRLTADEYDRTVRDLLGDTTAPGQAFAGEGAVSPALAAAYLDAAESLASAAVADLGDLLPCDPAADGEESCAATFIETFGKRAYRRPLTAEEIERHRGLFAAAAAEHGFAIGIEVLVGAMLQSPHFLYRVELGSPDPAAEGVTQLGPHEIASRLSYLFWGTMPDDELFAAADEGRLATGDEIGEQARRLLADDKAREGLARFTAAWLQLERLDDLQKDPALFPAYDPSLPALWRQETEAFVAHVVLDGDGDLQTLLTAPYSVINAELADFYGAAAPAGDGFTEVALDPTQRAGVLTQAALLAGLASADRTSPVLRGKFVRENLLCQTMQPPPADVVFDPEQVDSGAHANDPLCAGCHQLMDPIGLGFERYDAIGQYRTTDQDGQPIDGAGELLATADADGEFAGVVDLAGRLAGSQQVRDCFVNQYFRHAFGRLEVAEDTCSLDQVRGEVAASGASVLELMVALTHADAFRFRTVINPGGEP
jgi:hypothetical protein